MTKKVESKKEWKTTTTRFVAFLDILGFKELVLKNSHKFIHDKLHTLVFNMNHFDLLSKMKPIKDLKIQNDQTRSVTFSDSFMFFSESNTLEDAAKIIMDTYVMMMFAHDQLIPIKGSISYGEITVDFKNSLFFGQPIIDSYLLHDDLHMLTSILDHHAENRLKEIGKQELFDKFITSYKANMKSGKVTHKLMRPYPDSLVDRIKNTEKFYGTVSGKPRIYIDNTIEFYNQL